jgi:uncharacterized protein (TIGR02646 family)
MHHLQRGPAPACLGNYNHSQYTWNALSAADREEIRFELELMQGRRCAYCECDLDQNGQHVEHFRQRSRHPLGTFAWGNLFWSCERQDSCGKHKDACGAYNDPDLIKPDVEDPEHFFLFVSNGSIALRPGLSAPEVHRARETLRIFNLDANYGPLRAMRAIAVLGYIEDMKEFQQMAESGLRNEVLAHLATEYDYTRNLPFCTAIKHTLTPA